MDTLGLVIEILFLALLLLGLLTLVFPQWFLEKRFHPHDPYRNKIKIKWFFIINSQTKVGGFMAEKVITGPAAGDKFYGHIDPTFNGVEVAIQEGSEVFGSSDESIFTVETNPKNARYFIATLTGKTGDAKLTVNLDTDPQEGVTPLSDFASIRVLPGLANASGLAFDDADTAPAVGASVTASDVNSNANAGN